MKDNMCMLRLHQIMETLHSTQISKQLATYGVCELADLELCETLKTLAQQSTLDAKAIITCPEITNKLTVRVMAS
jgi:hypothetical protein